MRERGERVKLTGVALVGLGWLALAIGAAGCGGVTDARVAARNRASKAICDKAQMCGTIGPGLDYEDYPSCISEANGNIDGQIWPASQCQDIKQDMLDVCISAINGTQCGNLIDVLITLGTCSAANVCKGPTAADAGGG
jgi:hypothetical protein